MHDCFELVCTSDQGFCGWSRKPHGQQLKLRVLPGCDKDDGSCRFVSRLILKLGLFRIQELHPRLLFTASVVFWRRFVCGSDGDVVAVARFPKLKNDACTTNS